MKAAWIVTVLLLAQSFCQGRESAYQALRSIGSGNQALLNHVVEVTGAKGDPQPLVWRIVVDDPGARGGVREMEVSKGHIISEHTPTRGYAGMATSVVMDFKRLNLDSEGAFTIANQEATKHNAGFDSVEYVLRNDDTTNAPVWILKLLDTSNVNVGTVYIAADTGAVIRADGFGVNKQPLRSAAVPPVPTDATAPRDPDLDAIPGGDEPQNGQGIGHEINKGLHRAGATLQQFFTGKRTLDRKFQDEP